MVVDDGESIRAGGVEDNNEADGVDDKVEENEDGDKEDNVSSCITFRASFPGEKMKMMTVVDVMLMKDNEVKMQVIDN